MKIEDLKNELFMFDFEMKPLPTTKEIILSTENNQPFYFYCKTEKALNFLKQCYIDNFDYEVSYFKDLKTNDIITQGLRELYMCKEDLEQYEKKNGDTILRDAYNKLLKHCQNNC